MSDHKPSPRGESIRVTIFNHTYSLRSATGDGEYLRRVAQLVDERMRSIASQLAVHDVGKVAVLAALNLADELEVLKDSFERELSALLMLPPEDEVETGIAVESESLDALRQETQSEALGTSHDDEIEPESNPSTPSGGADEPTPDDEIAEGQTWFDSVFDPGPTRGGERLSAQVSTRLKSHVAARLRRLRQPAPKPSITEDNGRDH
ncbi:MAG TPA: cell division protein ZapA [Pyrinomonadaceae bacterium]|nr:cell division protein ZapA [Pyrinomonadaceae bacterium]